MNLMKAPPFGCHLASSQNVSADASVPGEESQIVLHARAADLRT